MNNVQVIDADGHIIEPANLWEEYLEERELLPLAPRIYIDENGEEQAMIEGTKIPKQPGMGLGGRNVNRKWDKAATQQRWADQEPGGFDPHARIKDMDAEGVDGAVLYPTVAMRFTALDSPQLAAAVCRAYNNWLADYCKPYPGRLLGVGAIPFQEPELAVREIRYVADKLGFRGVVIRPNPINGRNLDHPDYYPVWQAAQDAGCVVGIHEGGIWKKINKIGTDRFDSLVYRQMVGHPMEQMMACMTLIMGGVLEKFPGLRVIFLESGGGWLPYWLERMDGYHDLMGFLIPDCKLPPSEYFRRQCAIQVESGEKTLPMIVQLVGEECVVWGTDYPHFDCNWSGSVQRFRQANLSQRACDNILAENAKRLYGLRGN